MINCVKIISSQATYPLRLSVLWQHLNKLEDCKLDIDGKKGTFHVGAFKNNKIVAIGTFLVEKNKKFKQQKQYRLRAMATSLKVRKEGFGKQVIDFAIKELNKREIEILWCDARKVAIKFYKKMGFNTMGDFYNIPKIGQHKLMYKKVN